MQLHLSAQCLLNPWQKLKEQLGVMYPVPSWDSSTSQNFSFFRLPSEYGKALNLFKLCCDRISWNDFSKQKNIVSRTEYVCYYLARNAYG